MAKNDEELKDWLHARQADPWKEPHGTEPRPRYRVDGGKRYFYFFTLAGARAFLAGEFRGKGSIVPLCLLVLCLCSCVVAPVAQPKRKARVTYYCAREDHKWGSKTASGARARAGVTVAAERRIPFGTWVHIPALERVLGGWFKVEDRGRAVESRRASHGALPVVDVFTPDRKTMQRLAAIMPPVMEVE